MKPDMHLGIDLDTVWSVVDRDPPVLAAVGRMARSAATAEYSRRIVNRQTTDSPDFADRRARSRPRTGSRR